MQTSKKLLQYKTPPDNKYHLVFDEKIDENQLKNYVRQYGKLNPPIVEANEEEGESKSEGEDT